jgi:allophanate hydrolase subunit 2
VQPAGAFDRESYLLANALLGNPPDAAALELVPMGGRFQATEPCRAAVVGGDAEIRLSSGETARSGDVFGVAARDSFEIGTFRTGARAYLAVEGGFQAAKVLGSVSGAAVAKGDELACPDASGRLQSARLSGHPGSLSDRPLALIPVAGREALAQEVSGRLLAVSLNSDRRGIRLDGSELEHLAERPSEPVCVGTVQATPSGQLLVLGPDGPTIGGYPRIGTVCEADLDRLAQLRPGDGVVFEPVDLERARELSQARTARIHTALALIQAMERS